MLEVGEEKKQERTKGEEGSAAGGRHKPIDHPDLLADLASRHPGFDCKLRICVELCYSLSYDIIHCSLY